MIYRTRLAALAAACFLFWIVIGFLIGLIVKAPIFGLVLGLLVAMTYWYLINFAAEKFLLDLYGAKLLSRTVAHNTYEITDELSVKAGIEPPMLYVMPTQTPNAFVVARRERSAVIVLTNGLTQHLNREEVRSILALMVARISQGDAVAWTTAATIAGLPLQSAAQAGIHPILGQTMKIDPNSGMTALGHSLLSVIAYPAVLVLQIAYDMKSVFNSDHYASRVNENPIVLASALGKIEALMPTTIQGFSGYNPATAMLFAVPPLIPEDLITDDAPSYLRAQKTLPHRRPSTEERQKSLHERVNNPVTV